MHMIRIRIYYILASHESQFAAKGLRLKKKVEELQLQFFNLLLFIESVCRLPYGNSAAF